MSAAKHMSAKAKRSLAASKANWTRALRQAYRDGGPVATLPPQPLKNERQLEQALAACRSIRFAGTNAVRHGGEYNLNDLLAADRLAREALEPAMTEAFIEHGAKLILTKHRLQQRAKKGGAK